MRHFRFYANNNYLISIAKCLKVRLGVQYKFTPDKNYVDINKDIGDYDIYIDHNKYIYSDELLSMIRDYEIIELNINDYERLVDKNCERSYNELISKYKVILEERDKYAEKMLKVQRENILKDVLKEYKNDIDNHINKEVSRRYDSLLDRFHKEECSIDEVCLLYRKYIDAEIKKDVEEHINKILNKENLSKIIPYSEILPQIIKSSKKLLDDFYYNNSRYGINEYDTVSKEIKKFKNDLVDGFMKASGRERGQRDYWLYMKRAGYLADLIEGKLWEFYCLSIAKDNK